MAIKIYICKNCGKVKPVDTVKDGEKIPKCSVCQKPMKLKNM
jgi:NAD-dependent SIR2 family protein deacetylase